MTPYKLKTIIAQKEGTEIEFKESLKSADNFSMV